MSKLIAAVVISAAALAGAAPAVAAGPPRCNTITALNAMDPMITWVANWLGS